MEQIKLNLIPSGIMPVCHASQYDDKRQIRLNLFNGSQAFAVDTAHMTFELQVRKPDDTIVTAAVTGVDTKTYIDIELSTQMTAVFGDCLCQLQIKNSNDSSTIGTMNFILQVEQDVLANGDPSQSEIHDLAAQIDADLGPYKYYDYEDTLTAGSTSLLIYSDANPDFDASTITFLWFTDTFGVNPTNLTVTDVNIGGDDKVLFTFTFEAQASDVEVKVRVYPNS